MPDRFSNLDDYLPPAPATKPGEREPSDLTLGVGRSRSLRRYGRGLVLFMLTAVAAYGMGTGAARLVVTDDSSIEMRFEPAAANGQRDAPARHSSRLSLRDLLSGPDRIAPRRRPPEVKRTRRQQPRRVAVAASAPAAAPVAAPEAKAAAPERKQPARDRKSASVKEEERPQAIPAPPGTPLFDCYSGERNDHYTTIDRASAAQTESSRGDYDCTILGYVYSYEAPGTLAVTLDSGTAYIFARKGAETEPRCDKVALYSHSTGHDDWYSTRPADPGPVGYIRS